MRLDRLELTAFGPFTDVRLELGPPRETGDRLHVVYGPNEAGKSSTLRALRALLFGIDQRSTDNFVHHYNRMSVGATLRLRDGTVRSVQRRKGTKRTLLDGDGASIPEETLAPILGGMDESLFASFFAMGYEDLRSGGQALLEGKGEVGQSLFGAAIGGGRLAKVERELAAALDALFTPRGRVQPLARALASFNEARQQVSAASLKSSQWEAAFEEHRRAQEEHMVVATELRALRGQLERRLLLRDVAPWVRKWRVLHERLDQPAAATEPQASRESAVAPLLSEGFRDERLAAERERDAAQRELEEGALELERLTTSSGVAAGADGDRAAGLLVHADAIEALQREVGAVEQCRKDVEELTRSLELRRRELDGLAEELWGGAGPAAQAMPAFPQRTHIHQLALQGKRLEAERAAAEQRLTLLEQTLARSAAELGALGRLALSVIDPLEVACERAQLLGAIDLRLHSLRREHAELEAQCTRVVARLALRHEAPLLEIERWALPSEEVCIHFATQLESVSRAMEDLERRRTAIVAAHDERTLRIDAMLRHDPPPTEQELYERRRQRDVLWSQLRAGLERAAHADAASPALAREAAGALVELARHLDDDLRSADLLADRLRLQSERSGELTRLRVEQTADEGRLAQLDVEARTLEGRREDHEARWRDLWLAVPVVVAAPAEMRQWILRHAELCERAAKLRHLLGEVQELEGQRMAARGELRALAARLRAEGATGVEPPPKDEVAELAPWLDWARATLRPLDMAAQRAKLLGEQRVDSQRELMAAQAAHRRSLDEVEGWRAQWSAAVSQLPVVGVASPETVLAVLERAERWSQVAAVLSELDARRQAARDAIDAFSRRTAQLVQMLGEAAGAGLDTLGAEQLVIELFRRLGQEREHASRRAQLRRELSEWQVRVERATQRHRRALERLRILCEQANVGDVAELPAAEERSRERRQWRAQLLTLEEQIAQRAGGQSPQALEVALVELELESPGAALEALQQQIEEVTQREGGLRERIGGALSELRRMDGSGAAAAAAEQAQGHLAEARELAQTYMRLKAAALLLRRQVERYRRAHEAPLLTLASDLLAKMTRGSFVRIEAELQEGELPVLMVVRGEASGARNGERLGVEALSEGTLDQLYLALRLAYLESHLATGAEPLPLVLDDLLIQFDDDRAAATLSVLARLATRTQVLLFTHHQRIVDLARTQGDLVRLHLLRDDGLATEMRPPR